MDTDASNFYLMAVSLGLILLLGLVLNLTVILTFLCSRILRQTRHNILTMQLMVCDVIYLVWVIPVTGADVVCSHQSCLDILRSGTLCQVTGFLSVFQCALASLTLTTIAIDRYVAVLHPVKYAAKLTTGRCHVMLTVCWIWAGLTAFPPMLTNQTDASYAYHAYTRHCSPTFRESCWFFWYAVAMGYGIPLPTMTFCYFNIARTLRKHRLRVRVVKVVPIGVSVSQNETAEPTSGLSSKPEKKPSPSSLDKQIAKRGALLIMAYFLCWGPYALNSACPAHLHMSEPVGVAAMWLVFSLTVVNPIIYVFNNKQFRAELKGLFRSRKK